MKRQITKPTKRENEIIEKVKRLNAYGATGKFKKRGIFNRKKGKQ